MRILVIDDSRFTRALLRRELERDYQVEEAEDGLRALALVAAKTPDLILVDLLMPQMDGFGFLKEIREAGFAGPILVCSASTQPSVESRIKELGATLFVPKPELLVPGRARALVEQFRDRCSVRLNELQSENAQDQVVERALQCFETLLREATPKGDRDESSMEHIVRISVNLEGHTSGTSCLTVPPSSEEHLNSSDPAVLDAAGCQIIGVFLGRLGEALSRPIVLHLLTAPKPAAGDLFTISARFEVDGSNATSEVTLSMSSAALLGMGHRLSGTLGSALIAP